MHPRLGAGSPCRRVNCSQSMFCNRQFKLLVTIYFRGNLSYRRRILEHKLVMSQINPLIANPREALFTAFSGFQVISFSEACFARWWFCSLELIVLLGYGCLTGDVLQDFTELQIFLSLPINMSLYSTVMIIKSISNSLAFIQFEQVHQL